jgi:hypothetical protein
VSLQYLEYEVNTILTTLLPQMQEPPHIDDSSPTAVMTLLKTALEATDDEQAKYCLREAYQKCIVVSGDKSSESQTPTNQY